MFFCRKFTLFLIHTTLLSHYLCYSTHSTRIALVHFRHWTTHLHLHVESLILLSLAYQPHCSVSVNLDSVIQHPYVGSLTSQTKSQNKHRQTIRTSYIRNNQHEFNLFNTATYHKHSPMILPQYVLMIIIKLTLPQQPILYM